MVLIALLLFQGCRRANDTDWQRLYSHARSDFEQGRFSSALKQADEGLHTSLRNPAWHWKFRVLDAEILMWNGNGTGALKLLAVPLPKQLSNTETAARARNAEGVALMMLKRPEEADAQLKKAEILARNNAPDVMCEVLLNQGSLSFRQGQFSNAELLFRQALNLARQHGNTFVEASSLGSIGMISTRQQHFDDAIDRLTQAINLAHAHRYAISEQISVQNLAWSYEELGDLEQASEQLKAEEKVYDNPDQDLLRSDMYQKLGDVYDKKRNYPAARENYLKALKLYQNIQDQKKADEGNNIALILSKLAIIALEQKDFRSAEDYIRHAMASNPQLPLIRLNAARIYGGLHKFQEAKSLLQAVIQDKRTQLFDRWQAQAELATILAAEDQDALARQQFEDVIAQFDDVWKTVQKTANKLPFSVRAERFYDDYIDFLISRDLPLEAFQVAEFRRARTLAELVGLKALERPSDINISDIEKFSREKQKVVLDYWLGPEKSYLWVISPQAKTSFFLLPGEAQIETAVHDYRQTLEGVENKEEVEQDAGALYKMLVGPAQNLIPHDAKVIVVPDGALNGLNFESLFVAGPQPHFWIDDVEIETTSAMTLLLNGTWVSHPPKNLLLFGDPLFASSEYPALKHPRDEMDRIGKYYPGTREKVFSQRIAVPSAYQASGPGHYDAIQFVTHGTASEVRPLESSIILSPDANGQFKLYARDIINTPIKADLVIISACYGAGKRTYSREGLVGLAWAFMGAGAHQVVAGLWEIDDQATPALMNDFHAGLHQGKTAAQALRAAKRKLLHSNNGYDNPYYWASLQLYVGR